MSMAFVNVLISGNAIYARMFVIDFDMAGDLLSQRAYLVDALTVSPDPKAGPYFGDIVSDPVRMGYGFVVVVARP